MKSRDGDEATTSRMPIVFRN